MNRFRGAILIWSSLFLVSLDLGCVPMDEDPPPENPLPTECNSDADCDGVDGLACGDCVDGACVPLECCNDADCASDGNGCTDESCVFGACISVGNANACDDGDACTANDVCAGGVCAGTALDCNDGNSCTDDTCSQTTGCLNTPTDSACDDNNDCTTDTCDTVLGCLNDGTGVTDPCDDGNACTTGDVCQGDAAGTCEGIDTSATDCDDEIACTVDTCDPATGCAHAPIDVACDDTNICTADTCDAVLGCLNDGTGITVACFDENPCTTGDVCEGDASGTCAGTDASAVGCDDGDACTEDDVCDDGACAGTARDCSDGEICTDDVCTNGVCSNPAVSCPEGETCDSDTGQCVNTLDCADVAECDDGDSCTTDACVDNLCEFTSLDCSDGDICTDDICTDGDCSNPVVSCPEGETCDPKTGQCVDPLACADNTDCDDGDACTTDACVDNQCEFTPLDCGDGDICTDDVCTDGDCSNPGVVCPAGTSCEPGTGDCIGGDGECTTDDDNLVGSAGDNIFTCDAFTFNPGDIIVGNGGNDLLHAVLVGDLVGGDVFPCFSGVSNGPTLIDIDTVIFETFNPSEFDASNTAAIGAYVFDGASAGDLTMCQVEAGVNFRFGNGLQRRLIVGFSTAPVLAFNLTLDGPVAGAAFAPTGAGAGGMILVVNEDSVIDCATPDGNCFGGQAGITLVGSGDFTIRDVRAADLRADGGPWDVTGHTGQLIVSPSADVAVNLNFSVIGDDTLQGVDQIVIEDTQTFDHILTMGSDDNVIISIAQIDENDSAGSITVNQNPVGNADAVTVVLGGIGDGMGLLDCSSGTDTLNIESGGTTANAIADVMTVTAALVTQTVNITGTQDLDCGTVTSKLVNSTGLDSSAGLTMICGNPAGMIVVTGAGDDDITGSAGLDTIFCGDGTDIVQGEDGPDRITLGDGDKTLVLVSIYRSGGQSVDGIDIINGFGSGDSIVVGPGNVFTDGTASLTNTGAVTDDGIDISNNGTDTTIIFDTDTDAAATNNSVTILLEDVALNDTDFTFDSVTNRLTAN